MPDQIIYKGLGFPIIIVNPGYKTAGRHQHVLDIDHVDLMRSAFRWLATKPGRFSGAELKFIRKYLDKTQIEFAEFACQKGHSIIAKWEAKGLKPTGMQPHTEFYIRTKMVSSLDGIVSPEILNKMEASIQGQRSGSLIAIGTLGCFDDCGRPDCLTRSPRFGTTG